MRIRWLLLALLAAGAAAQSAEVYRWTDKTGKVHYGDQPPVGQDAERRNVRGSSIEIDRLPFQTRDAMQKNPVTLYANNCGEPCDLARQLLGRRGIPHATLNPEVPENADALKRLTGALQVPVLVVGVNTVRGFQAEAWDSALDQAGYPKTATIAPPKPAQAGK